ncbi:GNAT family N-acetyltransferase [Marinilabiliaceae bacterium JC017]|nr:GNAT family N-acetyltransferase [Marinilabiliaceae bacterium JC017]
MLKYPVTNFSESDLEELTGFLNRSWEYDAITSELLEEKLMGDPDWEPEMTFLMHDSDQIIGFMQGVIRDIRGTRYGYIKLMAVHQDYRRQKVASTLYNLLEERFNAREVDVVRIYDVPLNYWMPGIDPRYTPALCFAMRNGFKRFGDTSNLLVNLQGKNWSTDAEEEQLKQHAIEVRRALPGDKQAVLEFIQDEWALWGNEVEMAFKNTPVTLHIALLDGKVKGFSAHDANNKGTGWFGPMGTHPDLRGKGIGGILLKRCLQDMKEMHLACSVIPWVGPIDFYSHYANARVDRVFWRFEKILKP